jgi:hypothetical protein
MIILLKDTTNIIFISNSKGSIKIGAKFATIRKDKISQESVYYCLCFHIYCKILMQNLIMIPEDGKK